MLNVKEFKRLRKLPVAELTDADIEQMLLLPIDFWTAIAPEGSTYDQVNSLKQQRAMDRWVTVEEIVALGSRVESLTNQIQMGPDVNKVIYKLDNTLLRTELKRLNAEFEVKLKVFKEQK
jgi:hypothetical protein